MVAFGQVNCPPPHSPVSNIPLKEQNSKSQKPIKHCFSAISYCLDNFTLLHNYQEKEITPSEGKCSGTIVSSSLEGDNSNCTVQTPLSGPVFDIAWNVTGTVKSFERNSSLSTKQGSGDSFVKATLSLSGTTECQFVFHINGNCTIKVSFKYKSFKY